MSGHTRWVGRTRWMGRSNPQDDFARITQQAYVDGYILALEDFLEDTSDMDRVAGAQVRKVASASLQEALATRKQLREEIQDDIERTQATHQRSS